MVCVTQSSPYTSEEWQDTRTSRCMREIMYSERQWQIWSRRRELAREHQPWRKTIAHTCPSNWRQFCGHEHWARCMSVLIIRRGVSVDTGRRSGSWGPESRHPPLSPESHGIQINAETETLGEDSHCALKQNVRTVMWRYADSCIHFHCMISFCSVVFS